jgi:hypothetical protein
MLYVFKEISFIKTHNNPEQRRHPAQPDVLWRNTLDLRNQNLQGRSQKAPGQRLPLQPIVLGSLCSIYGSIRLADLRAGKN